MRRMKATVLALVACAAGASYASAVVTFSNVVDTTATAPAHGAFTGFLTPAINGSNVVFRGSYSTGGGIYTGSVGTFGAAKVVDFGDAAPGHGAFGGFTDPSISGSN